ncbi:uncharacterized protein V1518DRAFT_414828 [Limtongia smithiae]|uniref:uncharacterized protein n=1 Tax=Limtongia smithiae TaxID=1125753 RepID=UPI0034CFC1D5
MQSIARTARCSGSGCFLALGGRRDAFPSVKGLLPLIPSRRQHSSVNLSPYAEEDSPDKEFYESRELILSVLRSNATKRDAKAYLSTYGGPSSGVADVKRRSDFAKSLLRSVSEAKSGFDIFDSVPIEVKKQIRVAVVKIRGPESISNATLAQIGTTVARLAKLGLSPLIIVDPADEEALNKIGFVNSSEFKQLSSIIERMQAAVEKPPLRQGTAAQTFSFIESLKPPTSVRSTAKAEVFPSLFSRSHLQSVLKWTLPHLLLVAMTNGVVPVISPLVYVEEDAKYALASADDLVYEIVNKITRADLPDLITIDKIIYIDPLGGIPSEERNSGAHVLVNLEQEFDNIMTELHTVTVVHPSLMPVIHKNQHHIANLKAFRKILSVSPPSTSGLITAPDVAGLQSSRNPLIYNLLTDRPVISSSLPVDGKRAASQRTTLLRHGMPVMMLYSDSGMHLPRQSSFPQRQVFNGIDVVEGEVREIDMNKLVNLIENSFDRELDVDHYLKRINGNIAAIIIAGDYEGGAIITWEALASDPTEKIAYLDKFAVLRKNQGSAGVADIVFKAMVAQLFPFEIIWRSRTQNPVNRWYFDRAKGFARLPGGYWTLFWTGSETRESEMLREYMHICSSIEPSFKH